MGKLLNGERTNSRAFSNPVRHCVVCLYKIGFGYSSIQRITRVNKGVARRWAIKSKSDRKLSRKAGKNLSKKDDTQKILRLAARLMLSQLKNEIRFQNKIDNIWSGYVPDDERKEAQRLRYLENKEKIRGQQNRYYSTPEQKLKRGKARAEWGKKNKDRLSQWAKAWRSRNPDKVKEHRRRAASKPSYKISHSIRARVRDFAVDGLRCESTSKIVGCSQTFLANWIASKFKRGMSWDNYGEWHIDHVVPISKFDKSDPSWIYKSSHHTNLQPLWAKDNLDKSDTVLACQPELLISI